MERVSPFDPDRYLGTVTHVLPDIARVNLASGVATSDDRPGLRGTVGEFVFIESERFALLSRIVEVRLPDRDRLSVEPGIGSAEPVYPIGSIQMLTSLNLAGQRLSRGLATHPRIGDRVFGAHPALVAWIVSSSLSSAEGTTSPVFNLGNLSVGGREAVRILAEKVFGRHCGIFGTTGGGKSWTIARIIEEIKNAAGKAVVIDPTGEFHSVSSIDTHLTLAPSGREHEKMVSFSYRRMTESDLFVLFSPAGSSQGPKLRDAIRSVKVVEALGGKDVPGLHVRDGIVIKANHGKKPYFDTLSKYKDVVNEPWCNFDIWKLAGQIESECVWPSSRANDFTSWGGVHDGERSWCTPLIGRIESIIHSAELVCLFPRQEVAVEDMDKELERFVESEDKHVLRISMEFVSFQHNAREVIANAIGRYMLTAARAGKFKRVPMVIILDEAHQFMNKAVGDEHNRVHLDAFGLIAKEGRKYGLTCVLGTQRPRDIPDDVLSQLCTLIVHRLISDADRFAVERACGEINRSTSAFLPVLDQGEALIVGADFPVPLPIRVLQPSSKPDSLGPKYQHWPSRRYDQGASRVA